MDKTAALSTSKERSEEARHVDQTFPRTGTSYQLKQFPHLVPNFLSVSATIRLIPILDLPFHWVESTCLIRPDILYVLIDLPGQCDFLLVFQGLVMNLSFVCAGIP